MWIINSFITTPFMMNILDDESYPVPPMQTTTFLTIHAFLICPPHLLFSDSDIASSDMLLNRTQRSHGVQ